MSDGTLRFLAILTALLTRPKGSLLVIEEVDNGLHPSRSNLLLEMLHKLGKERGVDVLVTTHNPALLDAMGPSMVPFITVAHRNSQTGCSVLVLLDEISELPKLLAQGPIGQVSSRGLLERALNPVNLSFDFEKAG
jgi:predicted ATPase